MVHGSVDMTSTTALLRLLGVPGLALALGIPAPAAQTPDPPAMHVANGTLVAEQQLPGVVLIGSRLAVGEAYGGSLADRRIFDQAVKPEAAKAT